jgi:hypothetical protein
MNVFARTDCDINDGMLFVTPMVRKVRKLLGGSKMGQPLASRDFCKPVAIRPSPIETEGRNRGRNHGIAVCCRSLEG